MLLLAAGTAVALAGCAVAEGDPIESGSAGGLPPLAPPPPLIPPPPGGPKTPIPAATITALPGPGSGMALTVDDGASPEVVGAYIKFARDTGARFTFFVTAYYDSWTIHRDALRPLADSGQIQLANHTWDHPDLTKLAAGAVASQLERAKTFLRNTFGVDGAPYYRPPFGRHNATVDKVAADLGYTVPTMWYGSLSDSGVITEEYLIECARKYFHPQTIIIGHANAPAVTHCYGQLVDIIKERNLSMVTLNDVLLPPR
ncbi:peptidoglycan/xylan/chitin deacetylase (PgdA/CDA1 family) [Nocardia tenerifensis]|uniref:Peptidoglycan/xylan/chitin deacetylase (PgdA/CDA1 family) n=1 Tax=Nocardia tenerifensis TaxID=228006 RepID=A0A318K658_9NOCA|nr:polysaccharide deacetylase family protein [Nocardia tenerifensis]PXX65498.1 peptidoglycan/xylan/chitin deacetylase (PgdA/CDA1 family) [Nocardia tenerifensis]